MPLLGRHTDLFREEAIEQYIQDSEGRGILRVSPIWAWVTLAFAGSALLAFLLFSFLARIEVTERGQGMLRPVEGVRNLSLQGGGVVTEIRRHPGEEIRAGDLLLRIDNPQIRSSIAEAERQYSLLQQTYPCVADAQDALFVRQRKDLEQRIQSLEEDVASYTTSVHHQTKRLEAIRELQANGISGRLEVDQAVDSLEAARRMLRQGEIQLRQASQERQSLAATRNQQLYARASERNQLEGRREAGLLNGGTLELRAPVSGYVDGILVRPGDLISTGQVVARVVPADSPLQITAFLAERHRGFVRTGEEVVIELAQFPYQEFGTLKGRILRVGDGLANLAEWRDAMGDTSKGEEPSFRVEIELLPGRPKALEGIRLQPAMLVQVRYTLRKQTLAAFALEPLKRWLK